MLILLTKAGFGLKDHVQNCLYVCLLKWWAGNCSNTESLQELIQIEDRTSPGRIISNIRPTKSRRLILGLISDIKL